jgi:hypothetical protein
MRNKIFKIACFLTLFVGLNSCLKDNVGIDWPYTVSGYMYAEVWNAGFQALGLEPVATPVTFKFLVNIASDQAPTEDIVVKLWADTSAMGRYNRSKKTNYKLYPYLQIMDSVLTIKAGTTNGYVHVKVWNANLLNACDNYMAPISIKSATGGVVPSDPLNMGARLMALPISNPWAGSYHLVGYRVHPTAGVQPIETDADVTTVNCSTVKTVYFGPYTAYDVNMQVTSNTIIVNGVTCFKVNVTLIDPTTGSAPDSGSGAYTTLTGNSSSTPPTPPSNDVNYYNPVTKQFVLNAWYYTGAERIMYEILTRN